MRILVTGGAGYIGSHACVELANEGHEVVVIDNLSNSDVKSILSARQITQKDIRFIQGNVCDPAILDWIFYSHKIDVVIHFAGLKSVAESQNDPVLYYENNVGGTAALLTAMKKHNVKRLIFSSSACVYGSQKKNPIKETASTLPVNVYGRSKMMIEEMLRDLIYSDPSWKVGCLRYFNPVGAHPSGNLGENPRGTPNNLMPYITKVAIGGLEELPIYGNDYNTEDGTCVRDYIHVVDLAKGHIAAMNTLVDKSISFTVNLGTGKGYSVLDLVKAFEKENDVKIPYKIIERRQGDSPICYADPSQARKLLNWKAEKTIEDMCRDSWNWQKNNPEGYK